MGTPLNASILKGFQILDMISVQRPEITAAAVAEELGLNIATAHRFLLTLERVGALQSFRRGQYTLGEGIERLGRIVQDINPMAEKVQPLIGRLSRRLDESVMACRLGRSGPVCIAVATAARPIAVNISVGSVLGMDTAQGRLWMAQMDQRGRDSWLVGMRNPPSAAHLDEIRLQDHAHNRGETEAGVGAVCVPLRNRSGEMVLTLSVFGMINRFDEPHMEACLKELRKTAAQFTAST